SNSVEKYEDKTGHLISQCGLESSGSTGNDFEALAECLKQNSENKKEISSINKSSEKLREDIEQLKSEIITFESDIQKLFEAGSAENEEDFRKNGKVWEKRDELNKALDANRKNISRVTGKGVEFKDFTKQLESLDLSEINGNIRALEETLDEIEDEIDDKNTSLGQISEVISRLNSEDESILLESQRLLLLEDLHEKSREWAKRVIAGYLLQKAVEKYEEERQPAVIREAKSIFSDISGGRYPNIIKPLESDIMVEEINGKRKNVAQLSRGTAEQLYLALRFGYINEYGKHDVRLPVVFDDILVNFDPERKEKSCRAIAQLADNNQILYFTCHPETAMMLKESRPDAVIVDLGI
ncbi:MAG: hypothetical protein PHV39_05325, partial [Methanomicrobium sp.]|nr:hypothetical protein [Methanomicrobium sp.]